VRDHEGEVAFLSVAAHDDLGPMREFVARHDLGGVMPHAADLDGSVWARFGVGGQPTFVFVSADGATERVFGALSEEELAERLAALEGR
jgi:hypothetical protein